MNDNMYKLEEIPVLGGKLTVATWEPAETTADTVTVLAVHGVTSSHKAWTKLAKQYPNFRIIAPDLRGRGLSNKLPSPYGMSQHVADLRAVLDYYQIDQVTIFGHSMGGFVSVFFAQEYPELVAAILLVDGGLPILMPAGLSLAQMLDLTLGPVAERLNKVFQTRAEYEAYWRAHPAFLNDWDEDILDYVNYDLQPVPDGFQPATNYQAMATDSADLYGSQSHLAALAGLNQPVIFLRSPLGLFAESPGLYPPEQIAAAAEKYPRIKFVEIPEVNHYTIVMSEHGLAEIAGYIDEILTAGSTN